MLVIWYPYRYISFALSPLRKSSSVHLITNFAPRSKHIPPRFQAPRLDVDEICSLLSCYAASSGNCLPPFRDKQLDFFTGTDKLSKNAGEELPLYFA
jgi:hypothetical protein